MSTLPGRSQLSIAQVVGCSDTTVRRVTGRFVEHGIAGLPDRREDNGDQKLSEFYLGRLKEIVDGSPRDYGYLRPTWTRELLVEVMVRETGIHSSSHHEPGVEKDHPRGFTKFISTIESGTNASGRLDFQGIPSRTHKSAG